MRRHNQTCALARMPADSRGPVEVLLEAAVRRGAGLLVMGGYGHSRLREFVFGGFTCSILRSCALPVLIVH